MNGLTSHLMIVAGFFALLSLAIWFVFLRPVPRQIAVGVITAKHYKPAGTYTRSETLGRRSGFYTQTSIPIAAGYVFKVNVETLPFLARVALNVGAAEAFELGQTVRIEYQIRGVPGLWQRAYVLSMQAA
jgi:hypothetical protein